MMNSSTISFLLLLTLFAYGIGLAEDFPVLTGPYLGQPLPGDIPELFAPGIVTDIHHEHSAAVFSPGGDEVFWTLAVMPLQSPLPPVIMHSKLHAGCWTKPRVASFSGMYADDVGGFSPDGERLYFSSNRPLPGTTELNEAADIWFVEKTTDGWSQPTWLDSPINTEHYESSPKLTRNGYLYFVGYMEGVRGNRGIFRSKLIDGKYTAAEALGPSINTESLDWCPYVHPDEDYIIFSSLRPNGFGSGDLYVSFMQSDGSFGEAINLGSTINSNDNDRFPAVSPDGRYLFFLSKRTPLPDHFEVPQSLQQLLDLSQTITNGLSNIYWVDAAIIEKLKPSRLK